MHFDHILFNPQLLPDPLHLNFIFFLSQKNNPQKYKKKKVKKTSKTKTKQNIKTKEKAPTKRHEVSFVFANYSWAWGLSWNVVDISNDSPLEKSEK